MQKKPGRPPKSPSPDVVRLEYLGRLSGERPTAGEMSNRLDGKPTPSWINQLRKTYAYWQAVLDKLLDKHQADDLDRKVQDYNNRIAQKINDHEIDK